MTINVVVNRVDREMSNVQKYIKTVFVVLFSTQIAGDKMQHWRHLVRDTYVNTD